jgi:hypothetical protein
LCKEKVTKRKHTRRLRPALRAGFTGFAGFFDSTSLCWSKNARRPAARPAGLIREARRNQGPRQIKIKSGAVGRIVEVGNSPGLFTKKSGDTSGLIAPTLAGH